MSKARKTIGSPEELLIAYRIATKASPGIESKEQMLAWIEGHLERLGYIKIKGEFYEQDDIDDLQALNP